MEHEELKIQELSVGKYIYIDIFLLEGNMLQCKLFSLPRWKEEFSLPLHAAHRPAENSAKKCVTQTSTQEFERYSEYEVPRLSLFVTVTQNLF